MIKLTKLSANARFTLIFLALVSPLAITLQGWQLFHSFTLTSQGFKFLQLQDPFWHLAIMEALAKHFPPHHPTVSGEILTNYHYLSDLFLLLISKIFPLLAPGSRWHANSFMLDQPFDLLTNIHTYFGLALFLMIIFLLGTHSKDRHRSYFLGSALGGLLFAIKAYAGTLALGGIIVVSLWSIYRKNPPSLTLSLFLPGTIIFALLYTLTTTASQAGLAFAPGWLLTKMVEDSGRFNIFPQISLREQYYRSAGASLPLLAIGLIKLFIYLLGNFHFRLLGLLTPLYWFKRAQKPSSVEIFLITTTLASILIPLLFNQSKSAYNIIQFGVYALLTGSLLTAAFIEHFFASRPRLLIIILALILILSLPTSLKSFLDYTQNDHLDYVTLEEFDALNFLKRSTPTDSIILTDRDYLPLIPGLAGRTTYFSAESITRLTGIDPTIRIQASQIFFDIATPPSSRLNFLNSAKIDYIYLNAPHHFSPLEIHDLHLEPVFQNTAVNIYQLSRYE